MSITMVAIAAVFALIPFVIKTPATKITPVLALKVGAIVLVIIPVAVMPAPGGISIISISRVIPFIYYHRLLRSDLNMGPHTSLGISGINDKTSGHYEKENK